MKNKANCGNLSLVRSRGNTFTVSVSDGVASPARTQPQFHVTGSAKRPREEVAVLQRSTCDSSATTFQKVFERSLSRCKSPDHKEQINGISCLETKFGGFEPHSKDNFNVKKGVKRRRCQPLGTGAMLNNSPSKKTNTDFVVDLSCYCHCKSSITTDNVCNGCAKFISLESYICSNLAKPLDILLNKTGNVSNDPYKSDESYLNTNNATENTSDEDQISHVEQVSENDDDDVSSQSSKINHITDNICDEQQIADVELVSEHNDDDLSSQSSKINHITDNISNEHQIADVDDLFSESSEIHHIPESKGDEQQIADVEQVSEKNDLSNLFKSKEFLSLKDELKRNYTLDTNKSYCTKDNGQQAVYLFVSPKKSESATVDTDCCRQEVVENGQTNEDVMEAADLFHKSACGDYVIVKSKCEGVGAVPAASFAPIVVQTVDDNNRSYFHLVQKCTAKQSYGSSSDGQPNDSVTEGTANLENEHNINNVKIKTDPENNIKLEASSSELTLETDGSKCIDKIKLKNEDNLVIPRDADEENETTMEFEGDLFSSTPFPGSAKVKKKQVEKKSSKMASPPAGKLKKRNRNNGHDTDLDYLPENQTIIGDETQNQRYNLRNTPMRGPPSNLSTCASLAESLMETVEKSLLPDEDDLQALRELCIEITWQLSPLHAVDSGSSKNTLEDLKSMLGEDENLLDTSKRFKQEEVKRIRKNWRKFTKRYGISWPELLMPSSRLYGVVSLEQRRRFKLWLARRLPTRRLSTVYRKWVNLYSVTNRGKWTREEDEALVAMYFAYDKCWRLKGALGRHKLLCRGLGRSWKAVQDRLAHLARHKRLTDPNEGGYTEWSPESEGKLIADLLESRGAEDVEELRHGRTGGRRLWARLGQGARDHWRYHLYPQLFTTAPGLTRHQLHTRLIHRLYESEVVDWDDIDWRELSKTLYDVGAHFLYLTLNKLIDKYVPSKIQDDTLAASVSYLYDNLPPARNDYLLKRVRFDAANVTVHDITKEVADSRG